MKVQPLTLGAIPVGSDRFVFRVWAPLAKTVEVHLLGTEDRFVPMKKDERGYHTATIEKIPPGCDYLYRIDGQIERPDPASRWQPQGVHRPSRVLASPFTWADADWPGLPLREYIIYELHVGTFSAEGTFEGVIAHLPALKDLGITALELMPVAQFPGARNWGYDGVYPFAVQDSYGGPEGLKRLVQAAHQQGLAVVLDVVYNHLGPEGNYLGDFGPYFTDCYRTPWGLALNFDGPHSDEVRRYFIENALYWQTEFHIDALRLDAVHAIRDFSPVPFLQELAEFSHRQAKALHRPFQLIAESDMNMARHTLPVSRGGYGLDAQWSDDFHHTLHVLLSGERLGYYADFGSVRQLAKAWREGYAFTGEYSRYRKRRHGSSPRRNQLKQFVVCSQNHDQVGNRMLGDRLSALVSFERQKLAAAAVILSPFIPLLFMGQEYGETAPFQFFVSHTDPALIAAVRKGRREEFAAFAWQGEVPDPQNETTFHHSKLNHALAEKEPHKNLRQFYRELIAVRKELPSIGCVERKTLETVAFEAENLLAIHQWHENDEVMLVFNFDSHPSAAPPFPPGKWHKRLDSADPRWSGPGALAPTEITSPGSPPRAFPPTSFVLYHQSRTN